MKIGRIPSLDCALPSKNRMLAIALCAVLLVVAVVGLPRLRLVGASGMGDPIAIIEDIDAKNQMVVGQHETILNKYEVVTIKNGEVTLREGDELLKLKQRGVEIEVAINEDMPTIEYIEEQHSLVLSDENQNDTIMATE